MTIKLNAATGGGSVSLSAPNSTTSNLDVELTLPVDDGAANTFLKSDGSGTLSWASASSDSITEGNTTVECVDTGSDGHITFDTEGTERARIDNGGRLLLGVSSYRNNVQVFGTNTTPTHQFETAVNDYNNGLLLVNNSIYNTTLTLGGTGSGTSGNSVGQNTLVSNNRNIGTLNFVGGDGTNLLGAAYISCNIDGSPGTNNMPGRLGFATTKSGSSSSIERMQIAQDGQTRIFADDDAFHAQSGRSAGIGYACIYARHSATGTRSGTASFLVYTNGNVLNTNNSYGSLSDIKLKENIVDAGSQWDDLKAIQVRKYNFKAETNQQTHTQLGVIAQEVELVSPGLVTESPDREDVQVPVLDENGNAVLDENGDQVFTTETRDLGTTTKSVNYSVLYMKAVKALQEAMERIETLETANASIEARLTALEGGAS